VVSLRCGLSGRRFANTLDDWQQAKGSASRRAGTREVVTVPWCAVEAVVTRVGCGITDFIAVFGLW
jgi:hypothetical protein